MTTVQIETHSPRDEARMGDLQRLLEQQPGRNEAWAAGLLAELADGADAAVEGFFRAVDGNGEMLGGALLLETRDRGSSASRPWLAALWVHPEVRGRGLGRKLVDVAESHARAAGASELTAMVAPEDDATLFLSERWGFWRQWINVSRPLDD